MPGSQSSNVTGTIVGDTSSWVSAVDLDPTLCLLPIFVTSSNTCRRATCPKPLGTAARRLPSGSFVAPVVSTHARMRKRPPAQREAQLTAAAAHAAKNVAVQLGLEDSDESDA